MNNSNFDLYQNDPAAESFRKRVSETNAIYDRCICALDKIEVLLKKSSKELTEILTGDGLKAATNNNANSTTLSASLRY